MSHVFDEREFDDPEEGEVTELTLGSTGVVVVLAGLLIVCCLCFGLGYAMGHRGESATAAAAKPSSNPDVSLVAGTSKQKPAPMPQAAAPVPLSGDQAAAQPSSDPDADIVSPAASAQTPPASPPSSSQWAVKPALPGQPAQTSAAVGNGSVAPAMGAAPAIMVQIAAVSHVEDAEVLVNALRRRGYAVTAHRELGDNLIHVQVGPFANRTEAEAMKLKLLSDGYNAMVGP